ncbi:MAG TPA: hypothetical protein PKC91_03225 [Ignavibacteria bacterium]|nr:hypothetical protein [Ignavibacteria bacterium]
MPDGNQNRNLNPFLEDSIKQSLGISTSDGFTFEMMKRVQLEKEFAKEDVKTYRMAKYIIGGFVSLMFAFVFMFSFLISSNGQSKDAGIVNGMIDKFSDSIESISVFTAKNLGFTFDFQTGIVILLVMFCIFLFSFADRMIFKKGFK